MIERYLTTEQVANILQVHPFTILKFLRAGKLKGVKLGRVYRIKESDVHDFLEERTVGSKPKKNPPKQTTKEVEVEIEDDQNEGADPHYYII